MSHDTKDFLLRQFETAWQLTSCHLNNLTTDECLWRPAARGLHVYNTSGVWRADWPDREDYDIGPPSIAWITWHVGFWWSMVIDHSFGERALSRERIDWPGTAEGVRNWIDERQNQWRSALAPLTEEDIRSPHRTHWPFQDKPFGDVIAWANVELTKNAAEMGYVRFLYAARQHAS